MNRDIVRHICMGLIGFAASSVSAAGITALPAKVALHGKQSSQQVIVQKTDSGTIGAQLRDGIELTSSNPEIATVEGGVVLPKANGKATITAKAGDQTSTVEVTVTGMDQPFSWS